MRTSVEKRHWLALVFVIALAGCGGQRALTQLTTYPVTGKLMMNGEPVAFAIVRFSPAEGKGAEATGFTGADGTFQLRTYSNSEMDGIAAGEYKVSVEPYKPGPEFMGPQPKAGEKPTIVPSEKRNPDTTVVIDENTAEIPPIEL